MCHITMLDTDQIETLEALPRRLRRMFEDLTDKLNARDRRGTVDAYNAVMIEAGKSGERVQMARPDRPGKPPVIENYGQQR